MTLDTMVLASQMRLGKVFFTSKKCAKSQFLAFVHKARNSDLTHFFGELSREVKTVLRLSRVYRSSNISINLKKKTRKNDDKITAQSLSYV